MPGKRISILENTGMFCKVVGDCSFRALPNGDGYGTSRERRCVSNGMAILAVGAKVLKTRSAAGDHKHGGRTTAYWTSGSYAQCPDKETRDCDCLRVCVV